MCLQGDSSSSSSHAGHAFLHDFCMTIPYGAMAALSGVLAFAFKAPAVGLQLAAVAAVVALCSVLSLKSWKAGGSSAGYTLVSAGGWARPGQMGILESCGNDSPPVRLTGGLWLLFVVVLQVHLAGWATRCGSAWWQVQRRCHQASCWQYQQHFAPSVCTMCWPVATRHQQRRRLDLCLLIHTLQTHAQLQDAVSSCSKGWQGFKCCGA